MIKKHFHPPYLTNLFSHLFKTILFYLFHLPPSAKE